MKKKKYLLFVMKKMKKKWCKDKDKRKVLNNAKFGGIT